MCMGEDGAAEAWGSSPRKHAWLRCAPSAVRPDRATHLVILRWSYSARGPRGPLAHGESGPLVPQRALGETSSGGPPNALEPLGTGTNLPLLVLARAATLAAPPTVLTRW